MAQTINTYAVKISGDSIQNSQWEITNITDLLTNLPSFGSSFFHQEDELTKFFYFSQFLKVDIVREIQKAIKSIADSPATIDFSDLTTMESLLDFCQAHQWLHLLYSKLQLAVRKGHLVKAIPTQLAKQKTFVEALANQHHLPPHSPKLGGHKLELTSTGGSILLLIADIPASMHLLANRDLLEKEIGAIETRFNHIFGSDIELDLEYVDRHRTDCTSRHLIQNPQSQNAVGIIAVPIVASSPHAIPLKHFYVEGKLRPLMSDEHDYRNNKMKDKQKDQRHSYLCTVASVCPPESMLALVFAGSTIYDMHFYSQMIEDYILSRTGLSVVVITRTVNVPIELHQQRDVIHHHHHAIYHVVYALTLDDIVTIQVALGFGNKSQTKPYLSQPRLHFLDADKVMAVLVSKDFTSLHNKKYTPPLFNRNGFEITNIDMCFFPYLERALSHSISYQQWKESPGVVAIFGTPSYPPQSKGVMRSRVLSLRFLCKPDYEPPASHALDSDLANLAPEGQQLLYHNLAVNSYSNLPTYFSPQLQITVNPHYRPETVPMFKLSDVLAAKATHTQTPLALQRVYLPVTTGQHTPSRFAEQFVAAQKASLPTMLPEDHTVTQPPYTSISLTNRFEALTEDDAVDHESTQMAADSPTTRLTHTAGHTPECVHYLSQATGAEDQLSQRSSAKTYPEMTQHAKHQMDVAATAAVQAYNTNPEVRELYSAVVHEEESIEELEQTMLRQLLRPAKQGKITAADQRALKTLHNELGTKKAIYIRTLIDVPASVDTKPSREGLVIQVRTSEIDRLLLRTDLGPDDYLDILYKHHQIRWREASLQRAAIGDFSTTAAINTEGFAMREQPTDVVHEMAIVRTESEKRQGSSLIPRLADPALMHAALVTAIRTTDQVIQQAKQQGQADTMAQNQYAALVTALKSHRKEQSQLHQLATSLGAPVPMLASATSLEAITEDIPTLSPHPMIVDSISESTKRDARTAQLDQK